MRFDLKKSLFISMAALGLFAATATINANQADAKTYARVTSNSKMSSDPTTRNISFTGGNAIYTKAGTLRGARLVASTATLSTLANSNSSSDNFRAYRVATTNRGSVYYKVVSFDQQTRGWIYGGKSTANFGGGTKQFTTFSTNNLSDAQQNSLYKIASPGIANDGKTVTYKQPAWTQYKVGRQVLDSTPYANATFKIIQVGTRTREGDQWVQVQATDNQYSQANGWILYSGLTLTQTPVADNAIRINLVDSSNNNNVVKSFDYTKTGAQKGTRLGTQNGANWTLAASDQTQLQNQINTNLSGTGYYVGALNQTQINALGAATFGGSVNIAVTKQTAIADNAVRINMVTPNGTFLKSVDYPKTNATKGNYLGYWNGNVWALSNDDITNINGIVNNALTGTGYFLTNGQLTSAQQQAIAAGRFGDNVTITVTNTQPVTTTTTVQPMLNGSLGIWNARQMNSLAGPTVNDDITIPGFAGGSGAGGSTVSASELYQWSKSSDATLKQKFTDAMKAANAQGVDLATINTQSKQAANLAYLQPNDMKLNLGASGAYYTGDAALTQAKSNNLGTIYSPIYPIIAQDTTTGATQAKLTWDRLTYTAQTASSGFSGGTVNVYYTADNGTTVTNP
ncbi:hypothetical protein [Lentilactobacillus hilgardii]|uniref:S-layer protein n=1 Tax=Lentilactobacillus hilgardii (strain ATCC 8290 / DSM 20176 / CCUG 30140 / JCM 1155 / KCTC 3500 / NBRC 15886 / NCIMB 8040 / NRRL B-1843 / 9) TaxID=1423757 RepID=C0XN40_LENH9|nr:hypothetical protein [Lentilactobacillus hilgardii]EEI23214.1 S-layer protein [Lentilactobacillus hilgardii DSM 20176 = ATCC 8290]KRK53639.1 surface layer protein SlpB [Lentilactobacillus hilgardii DSM 20176 = ATCC 8290]QEU38066.1 hypothetical protein LH500_03545 [Lentilactobacillus hilgardii]TDG82554.1 hypothetical protein C5L34_000358 [Lentilactobacillus hilgardii]